MECGFIYLNSTLGESILYGAEALINITEKEFREMEKIEEEQMRLFFKTDQSCPLHLLYLESGDRSHTSKISKHMNAIKYVLLHIKTKRRLIDT